MPDVKRDNPGAFAKLGDVLKAMDGITGKVGIPDNLQYDNGTPVVYVATIQEFGCPERSIPARSFMRSTAMEQDKKWRATAAMVSAQILAKKITPKEGMDILCQVARGDIRDTISKIQSPPLSEITLGARKYRQMGKKVTGATIGEIARKLADGTLDISGVSTKPLVDSGIMLNAIDVAVEG